MKLKEIKAIFKRRPIGFIGHGPSLDDLYENIELFHGKNICWVGSNHYHVGKKLLQKINADLDFFIAFCDEADKEDFRGPVITESEARGNTLYEFLLQLNELSVPAVYLFGEDGYGEKMYSNLLEGYVEAPSTHIRHSRRRAKALDIDKINAELDGVLNFPVFNACPDSKITIFPRMSVKELRGKIGEDSRIVHSV